MGAKSSRENVDANSDGIIPEVFKRFDAVLPDVQPRESWLKRKADREQRVAASQNRDAVVPGAAPVMPNLPGEVTAFTLADVQPPGQMARTGAVAPRLSFAGKSPGKSVTDTYPVTQLEQQWLDAHPGNQAAAEQWKRVNAQKERMRSNVEQYRSQHNEAWLADQRFLAERTEQQEHLKVLKDQQRAGVAQSRAARIQELSEQAVAAVRTSPMKEDWPDQTNFWFEPFVTALLTNGWRELAEQLAAKATTEQEMVTVNHLRNYVTNDLRMGAVSSENRCGDANQNPNATMLVLENYQKALPVLVNPETPLTRLLLVASTGSGKTCSIHQIAEAYYKKHPKKRVFIIVPSVAVGHEINTQAENCPGSLRTELLKIESPSRKASLKRSKYEILTYVMASNRLETNSNFFKNSVIIMDEVHNLTKDAVLQQDPNSSTDKEVWLPMFTSYRPLVHVPQLKKLYEELVNQKHSKKFDGCVIVGVTATPMINQPEDLFLLLNMLCGESVVDVENFGKKYVREGHLTRDAEARRELRWSLRYKISMYDNKKEFDRFPVINTLAAEVVEYGEGQGAKIVERVREHKSTDIYANLYAKRGMKNFTDIEQVKTESPKIFTICQKVDMLRRQGHKQIVYSKYAAEGTRALFWILLQFGYLDFEDTRVKNVTNKPKVAYLGSIGETNLTKERVRAILKAFNSVENRYGGVLPLLLLNSQNMEGVDLKAVRHVHFMEQTASVGEYNQVIGRARRLCSHKQLQYPSEWTVDVHSYMAKPRAIFQPNTEVMFTEVVDGHDVARPAIVVAYDDDNGTYSIRFPRKRTVQVGVSKSQLTCDTTEGPDERNARLRKDRLELITDVYRLAGSVSLDCVINQVRTDFHCVDWMRPDIEAMEVDTPANQPF